MSQHQPNRRPSRSGRTLSVLPTGLSQGAILALAIVLRHQDGGAALALLERSDVPNDLINTQCKAALVEPPDRNALFAGPHEIPQEASEHGAPPAYRKRPRLGGGRRV